MGTLVGGQGRSGGRGSGWGAGALWGGALVAGRGALGGWGAAWGSCALSRGSGRGRALVVWCSRSAGACRSWSSPGGGARAALPIPAGAARSADFRLKLLNSVCSRRPSRSLKQVARVVHSGLRRQTVPHWPSWAAPLPLTLPAGQSPACLFPGRSPPSEVPQPPIPHPAPENSLTALTG